MGCLVKLSDLMVKQNCGIYTTGCSNRLAVNFVSYPRPVQSFMETGTEIGFKLDGEDCKRGMGLIDTAASDPFLRFGLMLVK